MPGNGETRPLGVPTFWTFLALAFALTWGIAVLFVLFTDAIVAWFGPLSHTNPLFVLAVYAPGFVGVGLVCRHHGFRGVLRYFGRLTRWRMPAGWWPFLVLGIPFVFYVSAGIGSGWDRALAAPAVPGLVPALAIALLLGPVEEFGWRGLALPLLQRRLAPFSAGLAVGAAWAIWHLPAFLLSGTPQSAWSLPAFLVGVIALSLIMTSMFNASRGSLLVPVLFHFQANNPVWPDAQPWDSVAIVMAAAVTVLVDRRRMLRTTGGWTEVVPGGVPRAA